MGKTWCSLASSRVAISKYKVERQLEGKHLTSTSGLWDAHTHRHATWKYLFKIKAKWKLLTELFSMVHSTVETFTLQLPKLRWLKKKKKKFWDRAHWPWIYYNAKDDTGLPDFPDSPSKCWHLRHDCCTWLRKKKIQNRFENSDPIFKK